MGERPPVLYDLQTTPFPIDLPPSIASRFDRYTDAGKIQSLGRFLTYRKDRVYLVELEKVRDRDLVGDRFVKDLVIWTRKQYGGAREIRLTLRRQEGRARKAAVNIGTAPTLKGGKLTVEAHLPNFRGSLRGKTLRLELLKRLRPERKFPTIEALKRQIRRDILALSSI